MKILEKFVLILYSLFMLIISVFVCLLLFNIVNLDHIKNGLEFILKDTALTITIISVAIVCIMLSVRCLFFRKKKNIKKSTATDILLENESGRLLISKNAIENAVKSMVKDSMKLDTEVRVVVDIDPANNISIYISVMLDRELRVRDLTLDLQLRIKNEIKQDFGLEVKQVNIKVDSDEKEIQKLNKKETEKIEAKVEPKNEIIEIKKDENN